MTPSATSALSVVIPTFNRAPVLLRAIRSVLAQTWDDFELLVVDDGSTDGTPGLLANWADPRIQRLRQDNRGVSAARNLGLQRARGELVTFLDSDDEAHPDWLATLADAGGDPGIGIVTVGAQVVEADSAASADYAGKGHREADVSELLLPRRHGPILGNRPLRYTAGCLAVRRELLQAVGGYAEELHFAENSELVLRLVPACLERGLEVAAVYRPLVTYYRDPSAWRSGDRAFERMRDAAEYILEHHGERLRIVFPAGYANYCGVAAVNAARLGDVRSARHHLWAARRAAPGRLSTYLRLALTLVPPLAVRFWRRHGSSTPGGGGL